MRIQIGIDPGINGAIAFDKDGKVSVFNMPETQKDIFDILKDNIAGGEYVTCLIEQVHCFPGEGVNSVWTFSGNFHSLKMALIALGIRFEEVSPAKWQSAMCKSLKKPPRAKKEDTPEIKKLISQQRSMIRKEHKNNLKEKAQQLFPDIKITLKNADALLILEYAKASYR